MDSNHAQRLIILTGPSCAGKSPLIRALGKFNPSLAASFRQLVLYNSRQARPGERDGIDYHFRRRTEIEHLKEKDGFIVMDVRGDLQALDINSLLENLGKSDVLFEGNPFIGKILVTHRALKSVPKLSVFMAPLSHDEILFLRSADPRPDLPSLVTDLMRRRLLRRTQKQKGILSLPDLENIEKRASSAYGELKEAHLFQFVLANHDGEDSENWDAFYYPIGDALKSLKTFVSLIEGKVDPFTEKWEADLLP